MSTDIKKIAEQIAGESAEKRWLVSLVSAPALW